MKHIPLITLTALLFSICSCNDHKAEPQAIDKTANSTSAEKVETDKWIGQWNGPEGTFLKLTGGNGNYEITIQDLDGPKVYSGISLGNEIQFERNALMEKIRATNGAETGMKWLNEKLNCLTIKLGEGFCRD